MAGVDTRVVGGLVAGSGSAVSSSAVSTSVTECTGRAWLSPMSWQIRPRERVDISGGGHGDRDRVRPGEPIARGESVLGIETVEPVPAVTAEHVFTAGRVVEGVDQFRAVGRAARVGQGGVAEITSVFALPAVTGVDHH
ncbi:hypothetical protein [Nocardia pseudovaccinii]|uniref:hypothetical protein n=1 Tax=Nocardia pseudovaccinii TaxID=189540 RepID=UPI0012F4B896|nr:hypothetical protein [Nocardia pseudovaccinii]